LEHCPNNWAARWILGKTLQALGKQEEAYQSFLRAHTTIVSCKSSKESINPSVLRELALECLHTKRFDLAVYYCQAALEFAPDDYTLLPNLATAKLFQGKIDDAERYAKKTLEKLPDDLPAKNVLRVIAQVRNGTIPIPTTFPIMVEGKEWE